MAFGTRVLKFWVLGRSGKENSEGGSLGAVKTVYGMSLQAIKPWAPKPSRLLVATPAATLLDPNGPVRVPLWNQVPKPKPHYIIMVYEP